MSGVMGVPDQVLGMLEQADARHGFPPGTMASILQQEVGGQFDKYLGDPTAYHYGMAADGVRRTKGGVQSSAFGPFGILDSTAQKPGWGVKPLQDKTSLEEHIRFSSDYLKARIGQSGSFEKGIASYGQGDKYAKKVVGRIPGYTPEPSQTVPWDPSTQTPLNNPEQAVMQARAALPENTNQQQVVAQAPGIEEVPPEWEAFRNWPPRSGTPLRDPRYPIRPEQLAGGVRPADFSEAQGLVDSMMARNQATLQNGWDGMRGWA